MTSDHKNNNLLMDLFEVLSSKESDSLRYLLEIVLNAVMMLEKDTALKAEPYERSDEREGYANGFKDKTLNSRLGELKLKIPQTRGVDFFPSSLEKGLRSEKALELAFAEMYLKRVSTRKVEKITEKLCGLDISSTQVSRLTQELDEEFELFRKREAVFSYVILDATYLKVRHNKENIAIYKKSPTAIFLNSNLVAVPKSLDKGGISNLENLSFGNGFKNLFFA